MVRNIAVYTFIEGAHKEDAVFSYLEAKQHFYHSLAARDAADYEV